MNEHLLKGNQEKFKALNIPLWQKVASGKNIKIGIIGFSPGAHHNGAWLINQVAKNAIVIEYNVMDKDTPKLKWEEAFQKMLEDNVDIVCCSLRKTSWNEELEELSRQLYEKGVIMIDSADNTGKKINAWPAKSQYWFVVGAYDGKGGRESYSSFGEKLDFLMYTDFACMNYKGNYVPISHTSGATQVPCGMVAILKEYFGKENFGPEEFKRFIKESSIDLGIEGHDPETGYGLFVLPEEIPERREEPEMKKDYEGHWAEEYIKKAINAGYMTGYPDGSFKPDNPITRAEFARVLSFIIDRLESWR